MKKLHQILQIVLLVYFGAFLIFFIAFDTLGGIFGMEEITSDTMVTITLIGLILFLAAWGSSYAAYNSLSGTIKKMEHDMNGLKAKIYDFEHPRTPDSPRPANPAKPSDSDQSNLPPRQNIT
ncbi:hypothetical protein PBT90_14840 [Algoriphagus halophytocola]|uniref:DUF1049 domain-containing protein n=1 Tax=Algoriphagus halophytocola TaxID=2991499 RepID=A0ABY6MQ02_9BACT|nr:MULTISPECIES: hypothetical protein [unclassified Algoriphagus]UZD24656.1 hypothetical protein OM944_09175 [Algoriphagus sp. TR-M5]WBL42024.1 hypothetical protein PBT90_14840 [Algoriphagus sp. TR-M9]